MPDKGAQILKEALTLPPAERAEFAERVLESLDTTTRREIDAAWAAEAEARIDAYDRGETKAIPAKEVFEMLRERLNRVEQTPLDPATRD